MRKKINSGASDFLNYISSDDTNNSFKLKNVVLDHENKKRNRKDTCKDDNEIMNICKNACDFLQNHFIFDENRSIFNKTSEILNFVHFCAILPKNFGESCKIS